MGRRIIFLALILSALLNIYLFKVTSAKSASEQQTDSNPVFTVVGQTGAIGGSCPNQTQISENKGLSCHYLSPAINLFGNISDSAIQTYKSKYALEFVGKMINNGTLGTQTEFNKRVDYIVGSARSVGLNPALFLGYWKSENYFSTVGNRDMGCSGDTFYEQVDCAVGIGKYSNYNSSPIPHCARSKNTESDACKLLKAIREKEYDKVKQIDYPVATFDDFAEAYGPIGHVPENCQHTYNALLEVAVELDACTAGSVTPTPVNSSGPSPFANFAKDLVGAFANSCGGGNPPSISGGNYRCIESSIPSSAQYPDLAFQEVMRSVIDVMHGGAYQCVGFVSTVAAGITGDYIMVGGVAGNVAVIGGLTHPVGEYDWIRRDSGLPIQAGDFPVWAGNPGHIAVVADIIDSENGVFNVAEANWGGPGRVQTRNVADFDGGRVAGWLRKK